MATTSSTHGKFKGVFVSKTNTKKLLEKFHEKREELIEFLAYRLSIIGEECVKIARETGDYCNNTGNLRSSTGCIILVDGKVVYGGDFQPVVVPPGRREVIRKNKHGDFYTATIKVGGNGEAGVKQGKSLMEKLKAKFPCGVVLIICAGMNYAAFVEDVRGKHVLVDAANHAEQSFQKFIKDVMSRVENRK